MAGAWVLTKKNGKKSTTPFTFSAHEIEDIARNSKPNERFTFINAVTRRSKTIRGRK